MATTEPAIISITNADLTTGELNGTGVFDILMKSTKAHLDEEFSNGRIKGPEYSQVYLGSMTSVMAQGTQFLLQRDQASYQALLLQKQAEMIELQKENLKVEKEKLEHERDRLKVEIDKAKSEKLLVDAQVLKIKEDTLLTKAQITLVEQQVITEKSNVENITTGTIGKTQAKLVTENTNLGKTGAKLDEETKIAKQNVINAVKQGSVLDNTSGKILEEQRLIDQKRVSERAQTEAGGAQDNSVIGKQIALYEAQRVGFKRNQEAKAAKIALDAFAIQANAEDLDPAAIPSSLKPLETTHVFRSLFQNMTQ